MVRQIKLVVAVFEIHLLLHGGPEPVPKPDFRAFQKNLADTSSPGRSHLNCSLGPSALHQVDSAFGPHTIELMALPFNAQVDRASRPLRFFSLFPCAR